MVDEREVIRCKVPVVHLLLLEGVRVGEREMTSSGVHSGVEGSDQAVMYWLSDTVAIDCGIR